MKVHHFALIFLIFFFVTVLKTDLNIGRMEVLENEETELIESLNSAASDAINYLAASGKYGENSIEKEKVASIFFASLYSALGIMSDRNAQAELELYIPVILLCDSDGFYVSYYDGYKDGYGQTFIKRVWSEKMPYYHQDENFVYGFSLTDRVKIYDVNNLLGFSEKVIDANYYDFQEDDVYRNFRNSHPGNILLKEEEFKLVRKAAIMSQLEEVLSYYTSKHKLIARQNGITYQFSFPAGQDDVWAQYLDDVNLVVVFQGYPYGMNRDYTFNKVSSSGANIIRKPIYYVEEKSWYYLAHKAGCPELEGNIMVLEMAFENLMECAKIGAFCHNCIDNGPRVPELK